MSQYIDRKTVLNIVYTQQATRMADAYETLLADFSQMTAWGRGLESDLSHARVEISFLKAEVERLRASSFVTAVPVEQYEKLKADFHQAHDERADYAKDVSKLKAEVERSTAQYNGIIDTQLKAIDKLKAEVERLRKAGDKLAGGRTHTFTIHGLLIPDPDVVAWNAAKEGKQP